MITVERVETRRIVLEGEAAQFFDRLMRVNVSVPEAFRKAGTTGMRLLADEYDTMSRAYLQADAKR